MTFAANSTWRRMPEKMPKDLKRAFLQNASAFISAKFNYRANDGIEAARMSARRALVRSATCHFIKSCSFCRQQADLSLLQRRRL